MWKTCLHAREEDSDRAELLSEPESGTAEWTTEHSDDHHSTRDDKPGARNRDGDRAELPSEPESGTAEQNTSTTAHAMLLSRTNPRERELKN